MSDTNHSPVSLAAGSYDYDTLKAGLGNAARGPKGDYDSNVVAALEKAGTIPHANQDARDIPGFKFVERVDDVLGVTERIQVYVPEVAEDPAPPPPPPPPPPTSDEPTGDPATDPEAANPGAADGAETSESSLSNQQARTTARSVGKAGTPKE